jgi:hypothetical protein
MDSHLLPHTGSPDPELQVHFPSIPTHSRTAVSLRCCCGREDCALLEHNHVALEGLEKDLETAARLGQVRESFFFFFIALLLLFWWACTFVERWITSFATRSDHRVGFWCIPKAGWIRIALFDTSFFIILQ